MILKESSIQELNGVSGIYALIDPTDGSVGYVGKSKDIAQRYAQHIDGIGNDRKSAWIAELASQGMNPQLKLIERCRIELLDSREDYWLSFYLDSGEAIYNESKKIKCGAKYTGNKMNKLQLSFDSATYAMIDAISYINGTNSSAAVAESVWHHAASRHHDSFDLFKVMLRKRGVDFNAELAKRT